MLDIINFMAVDHQISINADLLARNPRLGPDWSNSKACQDLLRLEYRRTMHSGIPLPALSDTGFRVFSQNDEDGHLHHIFSVIGTETRKSAEICCGNGIECNTANLIINHGWHGLLVDGDAKLLELGRGFYGTCRDTHIYPPILAQAWITAENVNDLFISTGFVGQLDLLSIDMDGVDYWVWKAIHVIEPRVVVVEYLNFWGPEVSVTIPYNDRFEAHWKDGQTDYFGASLAAFVKLGKSKGYRLVGSNKYDFNAYFVKDGIEPDLLPEVSAASCLTHPMVADGIANRQPKVAHLDWVEV